eukprot:TRINITY_DN5632_c0_g4_i1.p1 TRINITY_DN5632_c0_g4~~TRINITY_DN5632_c0_g4_i1.p1  ORF type:complete len:319 (+),score=93.01 TRINITY_DN5632_c0_g4_i1:292-1248(+)
MPTASPRPQPSAGPARLPSAAPTSPPSPSPSSPPSYHPSPAPSTPPSWMPSAAPTAGPVATGTPTLSRTPTTSRTATRTLTPPPTPTATRPPTPTQTLPLPPPVYDNLVALLLPLLLAACCLAAWQVQRRRVKRRQQQSYERATEEPAPGGWGQELGEAVPPIPPEFVSGAGGWYTVGTLEPVFEQWPTGDDVQCRRCGCVPTPGSVCPATHLPHTVPAAASTSPLHGSPVAAGAPQPHGPPAATPPRRRAVKVTCKAVKGEDDPEEWRERAARLVQRCGVGFEDAMAALRRVDGHAGQAERLLLASDDAVWLARRDV